MTPGSQSAALSPVTVFERRYASQPRAMTAPMTVEGAAWDSWRARFCERLSERLGVRPTHGSRPGFEVLDETRLDDHRRLLLAVESEPGVVVPTWLLVPNGREAAGPAVIAVHGHGSGVNEIVGLRPDGSARTDPAGYQRDFALALVRQGFVVAAPEMLGFGSRRDAADAALGDDANSCRTIAMWSLMFGTTVIGQRVLDLVRTLDMLADRDDVDASAIGIFGISGGATASLFASAVDDRFAAVALSGYVTSFRASVLSMEHCICNVVPGLLADAEMVDIALSLTPRPLLLEAGRSDPIFPIAAAEAAARRIREGYTALGAGDRFELDVFDGGHEVSGARAFDFLTRWLTR